MPRAPPVVPVLAEGRALKPVLWFPGDSVAAMVDGDLEQARLLTSRALGIDVDMCIVRCGRFQGLMAPGAGATDGPVSMCAVCTPSRILGCYELTDGLGGIMFRRMTDTVCRELLSTLGPFPAVSGGYKPFMGNTFMGSRVFPSGASIDSLSTYQAMVYSNRVGMNIPASAPGVLTLRGSTGDIHTNWLGSYPCTPLSVDNIKLL